MLITASPFASWLFSCDMAPRLWHASVKTKIVIYLSLYWQAYQNITKCRPSSHFYTLFPYNCVLFYVALLLGTGQQHPGSHFGVPQIYACGSSPQISGITKLITKVSCINKKKNPLHNQCNQKTPNLIHKTGKKPTKCNVKHY